MVSRNSGGEVAIYRLLRLSSIIIVDGRERREEGSL